MTIKMFRVEERVILTELSDGGGMLLHLGTKMYFTLNDTGVTVWKALATAPQAKASLGAVLAAEYDCTQAQAERDLEALLEELIGEALVHAS